MSPLQNNPMQPMQGLLGGAPNLTATSGQRQVLPMPPTGGMPQGMMPPFGYNPNMSRGQMLRGLQGQDRRMMKDYIRGMPDMMRRPLPVPPDGRPGGGQVNILPFPFPNAQNPMMQFMGGNQGMLPMQPNNQMNNIQIPSSGSTSMNLPFNLMSDKQYQQFTSKYPGIAL